MKTIFTFLGIGTQIQYFLFCILITVFSFNSKGQVTATEDFENETPANTGVVFSESGINFTTTFPLKSYPGAFPAGSFGYGASLNFLEIARIGSTPATATTTATISINTATNPGIGFKINSFAAYTAANNGGTMPINGIVTFTGTPLGGGPQVTVNVPVQSASGTPPAGQTREVNGMVNGLTLGNTFNNLYFTTLTISIFDNDLGSSTIGTSYLGLDHISFTTQAPVTNNYAIGNAIITEGNAGTSILTYNVTRSIATNAGSVQIQSSNGTATAGSDYVALPLTTVNFTAGGLTTQSVNITINGDVTIEPNETFNMTLSNPIGGTIATGSGVVTITDDDQYTEPFDDDVHNATIFVQNGVEFNTLGKLVVKNSGQFGAGGSSGYSAPFEDATNPYATGSQGSFKIKSAGKSFYVTSVDLWSGVASGVRPNYTFTPTNCTVTFIGTKFDGSGTVTHTAAITPTQTTNPPRDVYSTVNFAGSPLANVELSEISFSVPNPINYLQIDNFKYGVTSNNATQISIDNVSVIEGTGGGSNSVNFTVTRTNNTTAFSVNVASSNGSATAASDYTAVNTTLNFTNGGPLTQTVNVPILKDATIEPNETFIMTLSGVTNGTLYLKPTGIGTILNDDSVVETFEDETNNSTTFSEGGVSFTATGGYSVRNSTTFGSGSSNFYLTSSNTPVGNMGTFTLVPTDKAFKLNFLDAWVGTSATTHSSGSVTFTGTLFGGGTVTTTKTITATSATGAGWQQNIGFTGTPFENVLLTSIQVSTSAGSGLTECDIDNFNFTIVTPLPFIEVTDAANNAITNGGAATTTNNTDFGSACVTGGTVSKTFTIKNTGAVNLTFSGLPVSSSGTDASHFSISAQPTSPIIPGGSSTFTVVFDPSSAGLKNANISFTSNDATNSPFVVNIKGTGNANPDATITANNAICQLATLNLSAPAGASTYVWSGEGVVLANSNTTTAVPFSISSQTYKVVVTNADNCTSTGTKIVAINAKPVVTGGPNQTICKGTSTYILGQCIYNVYTTLSGANERPTPNASMATGFAVGTFNTLTNALSLNVTFSGLTANASGAHIHGSAIDNINTTAGIIIDFAGLFPTTTSGTFTYNATISALHAGYLLAGNTYVNIHNSSFPGGEIRGQLTASCAADNFVWTPGNIDGIGTTVTPLTNTTYTLTATNTATGCSNTSSVNVNVDPVTLPTAATTNLQTVGNVPLIANGCEYVAKVIPATGFTDATVKSWVETIPPYVYVPRHFEITPSTNPTSATGTVTLFYSQTDFTTYNSSVMSGFLPVNPTDMAGIANFQILKYAGTSPDGLGYTGTPIIIPGTGNAWNTGAYTFVWNATNSYWEVTFPVTGFSGFLAKSIAQPLPVNLISFIGKATEKGNELSWKTSSEKNFSHFEIQKSENAKSFEKIGEVKGIDSENYQFVDYQANGINYYRLKMIDLDGKYDFSKTISIENRTEKSIVGNFYPNPSQGKTFIEINALDKGKWIITTFSLTGKIINMETRVFNEGLNKISIEKLSQGVNFVRFENGSISEIRRVIQN